MEIKRMQLGMIQTNCYIFWDENTLDCAVVDPGDDGEQVAAFIQGRGLNPVAILLTHSHFDHILGIPGLRSQWPNLPVYCHPADVNPNETTTSLFGTTFPSVSSFGNVLPYQEGDTVPVGAYFISNNAFYYADEASNVALKGFRAYITVNETSEVNGANVLLIGGLFDDDVTGIDAVANEAVEADKLVNVYTIGGVLVKSQVKKSDALNGLTKGLYIVDGKKVVK